MLVTMDSVRVDQLLYLTLTDTEEDDWTATTMQRRPQRSSPTGDPSFSEYILILLNQQRSWTEDLIFSTDNTTAEQFKIIY